MRIVKERAIYIVPESEQDVAYLKCVLGVREHSLCRLELHPAGER